SDLETGARPRPRRAAVVTLVVAIAGGNAQRVRCVGMNRELVCVVRPAGHAILPGLSAIARRDECTGLDRDPQPLRPLRMTCDPAHVMRVWPRRKRPCR